jgi:hypothetical protein
MVNVYMSKMNLVVKTVKLMLCFVNMLSVSSCMLSCLIKAFNKGMSNLLLINSQCQTLQINCTLSCPNNSACTLEAGGSQVEVEAEAEAESVDSEIEDSSRGANKFEKLLKDADTPLHENTKHSKLGAIVRLYSIKCMGGWSNTSFSMLLEFINELMHPNTSLTKDAYEAKKYLRDLGLEYDKISACRNSRMLFWRENEKLDKCTFCNESRWKDDLTNEDRTTKS